jgi:hypothetical protein
MAAELQSGQFTGDCVTALLHKIFVGMITQFRLERDLEKSVEAEVRAFFAGELKNKFPFLFANIFNREIFSPSRNSTLSIQAQFLKYVRDKTQHRLLPFMNHIIAFLHLPQPPKNVERTVWELLIPSDEVSVHELMQYMVDDPIRNQLDFMGVLRPYVNLLLNNYPFVPSGMSYFPIRFMNALRQSSDAYKDVCQHYRDGIVLLEASASGFISAQEEDNKCEFEDIFTPFTCIPGVNIRPILRDFARHPMSEIEKVWSSCEHLWRLHIYIVHQSARSSWRSRKGAINLGKDLSCQMDHRIHRGLVLLGFGFTQSQPAADPLNVTNPEMDKVAIPPELRRSPFLMNAPTRIRSSKSVLQIQFVSADIRALIETNPNLKTFLLNDANFAEFQSPPASLDTTSLFELILTTFGEESTNVSNADLVRWLTGDQLHHSCLLECQILLYLRAFLFDSADAAHHLRAVSALIEPWKIPDGSSRIVTHLIASIIPKMDMSFNTRSFPPELFALSKLKKLRDASVFEVLEETNRVVYARATIPTYASVLWKLFRDTPIDEFPLVRFLLTSFGEFREMQRYVKLMEFLKTIEVFFSRRTIALYILFNCCTFLCDEHRVSLQSLGFARQSFSQIFPTQHPFAPDDFPNCETAYAQLECTREKLMVFQQKVITMLKPENVIQVPFSDFLPMMSAANISLARFLAVTSIGESVDHPEDCLRGILTNPLLFQGVVFTNQRYQWPEWPESDEPVDFFGLRRSDWARGLCWEPLKNVFDNASAQRGRSEKLINKREFFMGFLLKAYDPYFALSDYRGFYGQTDNQSLSEMRPLTTDDVVGQWLPDELLRKMRAIIPPSFDTE